MQGSVSNQRAREQFERIPRSQKKLFLWWIVSVNREATKHTRFKKTVAFLQEKRLMSGFFYGK
jgi:Bacteriocin-protection, YdeI or OmpD-Associated